MAVLGYKLRTTDGKHQVSLYPPQQVNVTQAYGGIYSHNGTYNLDNAATVPSKRKIAAPFDCKVVSNQYRAGFGIVIYHSLKPVMTPSGLSHVTLVLMHDNNSSRWREGRVFKQGEHIYDEGKADPSGLTTGIHVHMEAALGHETRRVKTSLFGRYHIKNGVPIEKVFFKNGAEYISESPLHWTNTKPIKLPEYKGGTTSGEIEKLEWISKNDYLTKEEQLNNAKIIYKFFDDKGWSFNAIMALLGNMSQESTVNPGFWEGRQEFPSTTMRGFGLVQWTPYRDIVNWQNKNGYKLGSGDGQLAKMYDEYKADKDSPAGHSRREWYPTRKYNLTYEEFSKSNRSIDVLVDIYVRNYLRPNMNYANMPNRRKMANWFAKELKDWDPGGYEIGEGHMSTMVDNQAILLLLFGNQ